MPVALRKYDPWRHKPSRRTVMQPPGTTLWCGFQVQKIQKPLHHRISANRNRTYYDLITPTRDPHNESEPPRAQPLKRTAAALKPDQTGNRTLRLRGIYGNSNYWRCQKIQKPLHHRISANRNRTYYDLHTVTRAEPRLRIGVRDCNPSLVDENVIPSFIFSSFLFSFPQSIWSKKDKTNSLDTHTSKLLYEHSLVGLIDFLPKRKAIASPHALSSSTGDCSHHGAECMHDHISSMRFEGRAVVSVAAQFD